MSEAVEDAVRTVRCNGCHEWYDARASSCYLCGEERPEQNIALIRATNMERLNGALRSQAQAIGPEAQATRMIPSGNLQGKTGPSKLYPGAGAVAAGIKRKLVEGGAIPG